MMTLDPDVECIINLFISQNLPEPYHLEVNRLSDKTFYLVLSSYGGIVVYETTSMVFLSHFIMGLTSKDNQP